MTNIARARPSTRWLTVGLLVVVIVAALALAKTSMPIPPTDLMVSMARAVPAPASGRLIEEEAAELALASVRQNLEANHELGVVSCMVLDARSSRPVADADVHAVFSGVRLLVDSSDHHKLLGRTGSDGMIEFAASEIERFIGDGTLVASSSNLHGFGVSINKECRHYELNVDVPNEVVCEAVDADGIPVAGARICASQTAIGGLDLSIVGRPGADSSDALFVAVTGKNGRAILKLPSGNYTIRVDHDDLAWTPVGIVRALQVPTDRFCRFELRSPHAIRIEFVGGRLLAHSLFSAECAENADYAMGCVNRWKSKIGRGATESSVTEVLMLAPDVQGGSRATLRALVPDRGVLDLVVNMLPVLQMEDPLVVDLSTARVTPCDFGSIHIGFSASGHPWGAGREVVLYEKSGGSGLYAIKVATGKEVRIPVGDYVIDDLAEPVLASIIRFAYPKIAVRQDDVTKVQFAFDDLANVKIKLRGSSGRSVGYARIAIQTPHRKAPSFLHWGAAGCGYVSVPSGKCTIVIEAPGFETYSEIRDLPVGGAGFDWEIRLQERHR